MKIALALFLLIVYVAVLQAAKLPISGLARRGRLRRTRRPSRNTRGSSSTRRMRNNQRKPDPKPTKNVSSNRRPPKPGRKRPEDAGGNGKPTKPGRKKPEDAGGDGNPANPGKKRAVDADGGDDNAGQPAAGDSRPSRLSQLSELATAAGEIAGGMSGQQGQGPYGGNYGDEQQGAGYGPHGGGYPGAGYGPHGGGHPGAGYSPHGGGQPDAGYGPHGEQDGDNGGYEPVGQSGSFDFLEQSKQNEQRLNRLMASVNRRPEQLISQQDLRNLAEENSFEREKAGTRSISIQPDQGFDGFSNFQPVGWKVTESMESSNDQPSERTDEKVTAYTYPNGVGPALINGCLGSHYSENCPCSAAKEEAEGQDNCPRLMESTAYIGVGFDGRGFYKIESRKASLIQRMCTKYARFMGQDVPDSMKVFGIFETTAETQSFQSASEFMDYIREKSGLSKQMNLFSMEASQFSSTTAASVNFLVVKSSFSVGTGKSSKSESSTSKSDKQQEEKARESQTSSNNFFASMYINVILYEVSLDEVKPSDINLAVFKDYLNLPASIYSVGADVKYQNFLIRWGTHFIRASKFGGQLKITKKSRSDRVMTKEQFASIAENEFQAMFSTLNSRYTQTSASVSVLGFAAKAETASQSSEAKSDQSKTSSMHQSNTGSQNFQQSEFTQTVVEAQGGMPEIAEALLDFYTPAFRQLYHDWIASITEYIKPFDFQLRSIDQFFDLNMNDLFPDTTPDGLNFGCLGSSDGEEEVDIQIDPVTHQRYYIDLQTSSVDNETIVTEKKVYCKYKNIEEFKSELDRRRRSLEKAVAVYMAEGPFPTSSYELEGGQPGCEENIMAQFEAFENDSVSPLTLAELKKDPFLISFDMPADIPYLLTAQAKYAMVFMDDYWFATEPTNPLVHLYDGCKLMDNSANKICFKSLILTYSPLSGFFHIEPQDFDLTREQNPSVPTWLSGLIVAKASRLPGVNEGSLAGKPAVPCNVQWMNSHRVDPERNVNCIHFTAATEGDLFVIFSSIPKDHTTWYYIEINSDGVAFYRAMRQEKRDIQKGMGVLGDKNLYQSLFVCLVQDKRSVMIQYGKADADSDVGTIYSSHQFTAAEQYSRLSFYTFGAGSKAVSLMDIRVTREMPSVTCLNSNYVVKNNHCVLDCHEECNGCTKAQDDTACVLCKNVRVEGKDADNPNGKTMTQCLPECPGDYKLSDQRENLCVMD